jgi:hypothetical protein
VAQAARERYFLMMVLEIGAEDTPEIAKLRTDRMISDLEHTKITTPQKEISLTFRGVDMISAKKITMTGAIAANRRWLNVLINMFTDTKNGWKNALRALFRVGL